MTTTYCTEDQVSQRLSPTATTVGTVHNEDITRAVYAAARIIDAHCARNFHVGEASSTRKVPASAAHYDARRGAWVVDVPDIATITSVSVDASDANSYTANTAYLTLPLDGWKHGRSGWPVEQLVFTTDGLRSTGVYPLLSIVGVFGWAALPYEVEGTAIEVAAFLVQTRGTKVGVIDFGEAGLIRARSAGLLDNLAPFRRMGGTGLPGIA